MRKERRRKLHSSGIQASLNVWHRPENEAVCVWRKRWKRMRGRQLVQQKGQVSKSAEETVVKSEGYCRGGRQRVEKRDAQIHLGDVFIKALIDGESSQY